MEKKLKKNGISEGIKLKYISSYQFHYSIYRFYKCKLNSYYLIIVKSLITIILLLSHLNLNAQTTVLNGSGVKLVVKAGSFLNVMGDFTASNEFAIRNNGTIKISGDWSNNSSGSIFDDNEEGVVEFIGIDQYLGGTNLNKFNILRLVNPHGKVVVSAPVKVARMLDLGNSVLEVNSHTIHVTNPNPSAILWDEGFVQGYGSTGGLARSTNREISYSFPVGNEVLSNEHRAVQIKPLNSDSSVFRVKLIEGNASFEEIPIATGGNTTFNLDSKTEDLTELNSQYFHHVSQDFGTGGAEMFMYYFSFDGPLAGYTTEAFWDTENEIWKNAYFEVKRSITEDKFTGFDRLAISTMTDLKNKTFILASEGNDNFFSEIVSPNGDGLNDTFTIRGLSEHPNTSLDIFNRWGDRIFESNDYQNDWSGTYNRSQLPAGTYFYIVHIDGNEFSGFLEIIL